MKETALRVQTVGRHFEVVCVFDQSQDAGHERQDKAIHSGMAPLAIIGPQVLACWLRLDVVDAWSDMILNWYRFASCIVFRVYG